MRRTLPGPLPSSKARLPETIAIIGAGPMGRWLGFAAARAGFTVLLEDVMPANLHHAQEFLRQKLNSEALRLELNAETPGRDFSSGVAFVSTIEDAVREADLAIDCVPDELESKLEILWLLDRMAPPRTVLATPTTRLSIADLSVCTYRPDKCVAIAADARNLAESGVTELLLHITAQTAPSTVALVGSFWRKLGFTPRFERDPAIQPAR
jgi:3-hydroxybutyryl-CoA dehydrogenase